MLKKERGLQIIKVCDRIHTLEQFGRSLGSWELADVLFEHLSSKGIEFGLLKGVVPKTSMPVVQDILNQTIVNSLCVLVHVC